MSENTGASESQPNSAISEDTSNLNTDVDLSQENDSVSEEQVIEEQIDSDPNLTKTEKKEAKKALRELKLKYNGKEYTEKLPFDLPPEAEEYMRRQLQMAKMAHSTRQEHAELERDVMSFIQDLRTNPRKALQNPDIGVDIKKLAAEILEEELENAQKSPEQIEKERLQARLQELEDERKTEKEKADAERRRILLERESERYDNLMSDALTDYKIPKTPYAIKRMAEYMANAVKSKEEPDMQVISEMVLNEMHQDLREIFHSLPFEEAEKFLGEEFLGKMRKARVSAARKVPVPVKSAVKDVAQSKQVDEKPKERIKLKDYLGV